MGELRVMSEITQVNGSFDQARHYAARMDGRRNPANSGIIGSRYVSFVNVISANVALNWANNPFGLNLVTQTWF
eukprot:6166795-Pleurochrysis_carterae.AAC.1